MRGRAPVAAFGVFGARGRRKRAWAEGLELDECDVAEINRRMLVRR